MLREIRAVVADDERLARLRLRRLCAREQDVTVLGEACDGSQAQALVEEHHPDLLFLDVQMPGPDGLAVLRARRGDRAPLVVLVTAHRDYALQAFELGVLDYLLKPFDAQRFRATIDRARERLQARDSSAAKPGEAPSERERPLERIPVRSGFRIRFVEMRELDYVAAEGNYVTLHARGRTSMVRETLAAMMAKLDPAEFVRVHRSTIVRIERVEEIEALSSGEYLLKLRGGETLTSGRSYRQALAAAFRI